MAGNRNLAGSYAAVACERDGRRSVRERRAHGTVKQDKSNALVRSLCRRSLCCAAVASMCSLSHSLYLTLSLSVTLRGCRPKMPCVLLALCVMAAESICETRFVSMVDDDDDVGGSLSPCSFLTSHSPAKAVAWQPNGDTLLQWLRRSTRCGFADGKSWPFAALFFSRSVLLSLTCFYCSMWRVCVCACECVSA